MTDRPIDDHAFLSDCQSAALVATDGSVDWLTFPRFASSRVRARLLDDRAGHFRVGIAGEPDVARQYLATASRLRPPFTPPRGCFG